MEIDDFVETSDVEELQELEEGKRALSLRQRDSPFNPYSPRKRIKLYHGALDDDNDDDDELTRPYFARPASNYDQNRLNSSPTTLKPTSHAGSTSQPSEANFQSPTSTKQFRISSRPHTPTVEKYQSPPLLYSSMYKLLSPPTSPSTSILTTKNTSLSSSSERDQIAVTFNSSTTPTNSPPTTRCHSPEFLSLLRVSPPKSSISSPDTSLEVLSARSLDDKDDDDDEELLLFTPFKSLSVDRPSSPLTSSIQKSPYYPLFSSHTVSRDGHDLSQSPFQDLPGLSVPQGSPLQALPTPKEVPELFEVIQEQLLDGPRYSLRRRKAAQLKPYTVDQLKYKQALRANPDAIVKFKNLALRNHHHHPEDRYEEDGETQMDVYCDDGNNDEDGDWEERERRRHRRPEEARRKETNDGQNSAPSHPLSAHQQISYPEILQDLSSTDEEEANEIHTLSKEARKIVKERGKQRKIQEKEERRKEQELRRQRLLLKQKSFPTFNRTVSNAEVPSDDGAALENHHHNSNKHLNDPPRSPDKAQLIYDYFGPDDLEVYEQDELPLAETEPVDTHLAPHSRDENGSISPGPVTPDLMEGKNHSHSQPRQPDSSDIEIELPRSKKRALARMLPKSMAFALVKQAAMSTSTKKHRRSSTPPSSISDDDEGPLLPGHTRTRKATNLKDLRDIRGDSESEQESEDDLDARSLASGRGSRRVSVRGSSSISDEVEFVHSLQRQRRAPRIFDLVSDSGSCSEDEMDDLTIQAHIADSHTLTSGHSTSQSGSGRLRDVSLIDWMLTRTRTIGGKRRERKKEDFGRKRARDRSSKYKFDVVTREGLKHGHERQTLLSFDGHGKSRKGGYRPKDTSASFGATSHSRPSRASDRISADKDEVMDNEDDYVPERDHRKMSWKEREKARKARAKKQGLYTFASNAQTYIERGRRETAFITVDLQDEGFHYALAPQQDQKQTQNWATMFKPIPDPLPAQSRDKFIDGNTDQQESTTPQVKSKKKKQERIIPGDLGVPLLHSGKSFGLSTSIRKGWLHELLGLITTAQEPVLPPSTSSCGFELGPTMGADNLASILQDICSTLFEFVTDLPDADSETTIKGAVIMRVVPLLVSWFRKTENEGAFASLREAGEKEIARLVDRIQKLTFPFVDMAILATCWFAIETCARFGCRLEGQPPTGLLKESAMTLIHLLLQVGLEKPIAIVKSDAELTEPSVAHFVAELWVSLVHLLGECDSLENTNRRIHPFWLLLMTAIQVQPEGQKPRTNLEASETIWYTIFSVCALSQYSVHGMTTGLPRLPACWDLVVLALKKIRLNEDPKTDLGMPSAMLLQRDKYIGLVMTRCFHLRERWRWKLDDGSILFNQLAVIFRSRKFANLRHEGTGYPKFFKDRNWDLLASYDPKDTAFVIFVKLIVQAAKDDQGSIQGKLSLKAKKLLSLAVPVASLPFSKTNPPTLHELTMFYNRLSAVAIAVYLEPEEYDFRTRQAREYIKFADADDTTRSAVIGGMMNWAIMMVNREIKLDAMTSWIGDMAQVLSVELKENLKVAADELNKANSLRRDCLVLLSCVLLGAVRHILTAYTGLGRYPDPALLLSLRPILHSLFNKEDSKAQGELGLLADSFFSARSAAMLPPDRPVRAPARVVAGEEENGEESQDYGVMDIEINWSSVDIPEALAVDNEEKSSSSNASHEKALASILASLGFRWIMYRFLKPYLVPPPRSASFHVYAKQCDMWLRCAVGCTCVEVGDHKWDFWFSILDPHLAQVDDRWVRRVKLSLMLKVLRAEPMAYLTYMDRFIDAYLHALGSDSTALEKDYVSFLLSIDNLQHPLLCNIQCLPERNQESGDYEFTVERFLELRLPLLRVFFSNLDRLLREQHAGNVALRIDNDQYIEKCREMFSVMRSTRTSLEGTKEYSDYNDFCIKVFQSLQEYPTFRMAENMSFWIDLGRVNN